MPIPSPKERPDLYDDFDGLPEGEKSAVTVPPEIQKLLDAKKGGQEQPEGGEAPPAEGAGPAKENPA